MGAKDKIRAIYQRVERLENENALMAQILNAIECILGTGDASEFDMSFPIVRKVAEAIGGGDN